MSRILSVCLLLLSALIARPAAVHAEAPIFAPFDPAPLDAAEKRLLQTALAATGDYDGPLDGVWGPASRGALTAYATRAFDGPPLFAHAGVLVLGFVQEVGASGWEFTFFPDLDLSLALPLARLGPPEAEDGGERRWSEDGALTVLTHRFGDTEALAWHDAAAHAVMAGDDLTVRRTPDRYVTAGRLRDGRRFFTRSDRMGRAWSTIFLAGDSGEENVLALAGGSIRRGPPEPWDLTGGGRLGAVVAATADFLEASRAVTRLDPAPSLAAAGPAAPGPTTLPRDEGGIAGTGTGFYLGPRTIVTAAHVVSGCARVTLADGRPLSLIASDAGLDVAALGAPATAGAWLSLSDGGPRLGQRVHAAGFPYYSIAGTSLNLTGGNVSALAGVDDDNRFLSFTAPVQPGNSGGPLIDARGTVIGLVVARLSEDFIAETTGSLPQNVNYALTESELAAFLAHSGVAAAAGGLAAFDTDAGVPTGFGTAVVPLVCE